MHGRDCVSSKKKKEKKKLHLIMFSCLELDHIIYIAVAFSLFISKD